MKSLRERVAIEQAFLNGVEVEHQYINSTTCDWFTITAQDPLFDWKMYDFRIKPQSLTVFCNVYAERVYCHTSERVAKNAVQQDAIRAGVKCVECE